MVRLKNEESVLSDTLFMFCVIVASLLLLAWPECESEQRFRIARFHCVMSRILYRQVGGSHVSGMNVAIHLERFFTFR